MKPNIEGTSFSVINKPNGGVLNVRDEFSVSTRELETLLYLSAGAQYPEIGKQMGIQASTASSYMGNLRDRNYLLGNQNDKPQSKIELIDTASSVGILNYLTVSMLCFLHSKELYESSLTELRNQE